MDRKLKRLSMAVLAVIVACAPLSACMRYEVETVASLFSKERIWDIWGGDIDSALLVFPDKVTENMQNVSYYHKHSTGLFDTDGTIFLQYTLSEEDFASEIKRLSSIEVNVNDVEYNGVGSKSIVHNETDYPKEAFVAIEGFKCTVEYALVDREEFTVTCVYISYLTQDQCGISKEYLPSSYNEYINSNFQGFSIYSFPFSGGQYFYEYEIGEYLNDKNKDKNTI